MLVLCSSLTLSALVLSAPAPTQHGVRSRLPMLIATEPSPQSSLTSILAACNFADWDDLETWALEDNVRRFAIGGGQHVLWRRISMEVPELLHRPPEELRTRWLAMVADRAELREDFQDGALTWEDLPCLEKWVETGPGLYQGQLHGLDGVRDGSLRVTVEHDAEAALAAGDTVNEAFNGVVRCVRTSTGELFQLGLPSEEPDEAAASNVVQGLLPRPVELPAAARAAAGTLVSPVLAGATLLAASAIGYMVLGHHHVDVSVFIV